MPYKSTEDSRAYKRLYRARRRDIMRAQARALYAKAHPREPDRVDELWLPVVGYEMLYEVSCCGRLRSRWNRGSHTIQEAFSLLHPTVAPTGYCVVNLSQQARQRRQHAVHVLVASAFIGPPPTPNHEVNHKDGCKTNNVRSNLEWVTGSGNIQHAVRAGLSRVGERHPGAKMTPAIVREIRARAGVESQSEMARRFGVSQSVISGVINRKSWAHVV